MASNFTQREQLGYEIDQDINELRKLDARIKQLEKKKNAANKKVLSSLKQKRQRLVYKIYENMRKERTTQPNVQLVGKLSILNLKAYKKTSHII